MTISFTGFSMTLANSATSTPAFLSCSMVRSYAPLAFADLPPDISSSAFFPGMGWLPSSSSFPLPNKILVGLLKSKFMFIVHSS